MDCSKKTYSYQIKSVSSNSSKDNLQDNRFIDCSNSSWRAAWKKPNFGIFGIIGLFSMPSGKELLCLMQINNKCFSGLLQWWGDKNELIVNMIF